MGDAGAASLASALEKNATLLELYLYHEFDWSNELGAAGAESLERLASALARNSSTEVAVARGWREEAQRLHGVLPSPHPLASEPREGPSLSVPPSVRLPPSTLPP